MTNNKIVVIDAATNETIERQMTESELEIYNLTITSAIQESEANASARANALSKLAALGLTEDDLKALGL